MRPSRVVHILLWALIFIMAIHILRMNSSPGDLSELTAQKAEGGSLMWHWPGASSGVGGRRAVFSAASGAGGGGGFGDDGVGGLGPRVDEADLAELARSAWRPLALSPNQPQREPILLTRTPLSRHRTRLEPMFLVNPNNRTALRQAVNAINEAQNILNMHLYNETEFVIAVQVHNRLEYLSLLIQSLRRAKDIHKALVIFSHDDYSVEMNRLIRSIGFCKVLQIFFPFSQQIYRRTFPDESPNDCPRNIKRVE